MIRTIVMANTRHQPSAILTSVHAFAYLFVRDWVIRSARIGSVAARAFATPASS
jgi:hypothetical protein